MSVKKSKTRPQPHHHRHTKSFVKVYWPYIPLLLIVSMGLGLGLGARPNFGRQGVLAYATNTSVQGLLEATNSERVANGTTNLSLNSKLSAAAQAKANDMVARNYWSHVTPDGKQPWYFIDQTGYSYFKAGENLAYGFTTSSATVGGWMNSPTHRDNLLDSAFSDVGFGIANSADYQNSGEETVVVAMYGKPQIAAVPSPTNNTPVPAVKPVPKPVTKTVPVPAAAAEPTPTPTPEPSPISPLKDDKSIQPASTPAATPPEPPAKKISKVQSLTLGKAPWSSLAVGLFTGASLAGFVVKHGLGLRRLIVGGERFILHHPLLDTTLLSLVMLGFFMSQTAGIIR